MAKQACERDGWKHYAFVDTLAAAYAEDDDFDQAIHYQKQALSMAKPTDKFQTEGQQRLQLYQQRKPYREPPK